MITAVLLAAGYATRLYPLTKDRPKALLRLGSGTILDGVIRTLPEVPELRKTVLVTNHRFAEPFREWQRARNAGVVVLDDGTTSADTRFGAIRDLALARRDTDPDDDLLVIGTDNLFHWSLAEFVAEARRRHPTPSIALWQAPSKAAATQFGVVTRDRTARITAFVEKSPQPPSAEVALCVYFFPGPMCGDIQRFLDAGGNADAPGYFIKWLVERGEVCGIMMPGAWYDIGSLDSYDTVLKEWPSTR
jgi:glucose-1-phosphate thymidylyltransferase